MNKDYIHSTEIMTIKLSNTFGTVGVERRREGVLKPNLLIY